MKLFKNNQDERRHLPKIKHFLTKMVQMRGCFLTKCINDIHEDKNIKQMRGYSQETGRSMVEMLGVLAIIGVLSVGGIAGYSKAMYKQKMNKSIDIVSNILMGMREWASKYPNESGGAAHQQEYAIKLGILDKSLCNNRNECTLPVGGKISVYFSSIEINLQKASNPVNLCVDFLSHHWESALPDTNSYIAAVNYAGTFNYIYQTDTKKEVKLNYTLNDIKNACNRACNNNYGLCYIYLGIR